MRIVWIDPNFFYLYPNSIQTGGVVQFCPIKSFWQSKYTLWNIPVRILNCHSVKRSMHPRFQAIRLLLISAGQIHMMSKDTINCPIVQLSVRKRASVRTEWEKALSRLRSRPQPGALTLRISQENSIFSTSRKRRMGSLFSSPRTSCLDPFLIDHFPLLTSQGSVRRGL